MISAGSHAGLAKVLSETICREYRSLDDDILSFSAYHILLPRIFSYFSDALSSSFFLAMSATESPMEPLLRGSTSKNTRGLLRIIILCTIAAAAVSARLFSVIRMYCAFNLCDDV